MLPVLPPAILALADGTVFSGTSIGAAGHTVGEVVFNTALTGYQEILTDPSYCRQIVTLTYPHVGSYGVSEEDVEASKIHAAGLIIKDLPRLVSNFRNTQTLGEYLHAGNIVAIADIDTRKLTRILREKGAQNGAIVAGETDIAAASAKALELARAFPGLAGMDLAKEVSVKQAYNWTETEWKLGRGYGQQITPKYHVVAFDYGFDHGGRLVVWEANPFPHFHLPARRLSYLAPAMHRSLAAVVRPCECYRLTVGALDAACDRIVDVMTRLEAKV